MAKTVSELLQRVKKVLEDSQQNVVGNFRALSNPETRADWARPISSAASNLVKQVVPPSTRFTMEAMKPAAREFSAHAKTFGSGIGTAIKSPFELARQNKEAETIRRLQQTLNNQANRQLKEGNIDRSRQLSQISAQHGEDQAQRFSKFGNDLKQGIRNTVAGGVGLGLQLVGAKGLTLPSAAKYAGVSGLIGGGMSKLTGGKFSEGFGEGAGNFLTYRGVNKLTQPTVDKITGKQLRVPLKKKIAVAAAANAGANVLEDEILTRIKTQKAPTNAERLTSAAIGAGIGAAGPTGSAIKDKFKQITGQYAPSRLNRKIPLKKAQSSQVSLETLMKQPRSARGEYAGWSEAQMMAIRQHPDFSKANLSPKLRKLFNDFDSKYQNPRGKWIKKPDGTGYMREQLQPAYGLAAGLEPDRDENGNITGVKIDPAKAMAGIAIMGGVKAVKNGDLKFDGNYQRGDIKILQKELDNLLGTEDYKVSSKWQANLPARQSAKSQIEHFASQGDSQAKQLLEKIDSLEEQIFQAQSAKSSPKVKLVSSSKNNVKEVKQIDSILQEISASKIGNQGKVLNREELATLGNYLRGQNDPLRGTVYKPYGGGEDVVFGVIKDRNFKGQTEYLVMNNSGHTKGRFRLHSTPIDPSSVISKDFFAGEASVLPNKQISSGDASSNNYYHASPAEGIKELRASKDGQLGSGVYLAKNQGDARTASAHQADGNLADIVTYEVKIKNSNLFKTNKSFLDPKEIEAIKKQGYSGIETPFETVVFDPKNIQVVSENNSKTYSDELDKLLDTKPVFDAGEMSSSESKQFVKNWNEAAKSGVFGEGAPLVSETTVKSGFVPISKVIENKPKVPLKKPQLDMSDPKNQQLDHLMNDGTRLLGMGYSRAQVDKIGAAEARKIIEQNIQPFDHPTYTGKPPINDEFAPQIGNKPKRIAGNKYSQFEPTKEEADFTKAQSYYNEIQQPGIKRWFNSVFNPLKNAPPEVQNIMQDWRNQNLVSRTKANEIAQQFTDIPEQDGWKIIQYIQNPTNRSAFDLGLDVKAYKPQIERLRGFYDQTRQEGLSQGLEINYLDNYLNQIWKESPEQIQAKIKAGAGSRPGFTKERFIPTYQEGVEIGLTPRFTHPAQLAAHYRLQLDKALSNKLMTDRLIESELLLPASSAPIDWKSIESPFFPKVKVDNGGSEPIVMDYKAPPDIANAINNIFDFKEPGLMSKVGSFASNLQNITLSGGIPFTPINSFTMANLQKDMLSGRVRGPLTATALSFSQKATKNYFTNNSQILSDMASEGIRINSNADYSKLYKNLVDNDGLWGKAKELFHSAFDKPTFERFMPMLQVEFYKDVYSGALKNGLDSTSAKKVAANATKNFYGLTDAFSRSIETEDAMRAVLLAPQFREAMIGFWGNTLKSVNPRTWRDPAFAQNRKFIVGSAIVFGLYNLANFANTGRWMHENKDGKELSLEIPLGGGRSFFSPFQFTISTVPRRFIEAGGYLAGGDIAGAAERLSTFASMPIQVATPLLTNRTFYDTPIYDAEDDSALGKIGKLAGYATEQVLPGPLGGMLAVAQGRKSIKEALPTIVEAPLYPSASSDVAHLKGKQVDQFKDLYEQNPDTAYQFSEAKKQSQALSDQKKTLEKQYKPQEKNWLEKLFSGNEVQASSSAENALLTDENLMYWDEEAEAVKTINYGKYTQAAPTDPIKKIRFENDKFDVAMSVFRAESNSLTDTQKEEVYKKLGVSGEDLEYYDLAAGSDYESSQIKREVVSQYLANIGPKDDKIEALKSLRRKVRGSRILSDNHIEELVDQGYLTGAEGKYLESIDWDEKTKSYTKTKKSGKKVSIKATPLQRRQIAASAGKVPLIKFGGGQRAGISIQLPQRQSQRQPRKIQLKRMALPQVNIKPTYFQGLSV